MASKYFTPKPVKLSQYQLGRRDGIKEVYAELTENNIRLINAIGCVALRRWLGWDEEKITEFIERSASVAREMNRKGLHTEEMIDVCEEELGISFDVGEG